jgi:hypothetical protein
MNHMGSNQRGLSVLDVFVEPKEYLRSVSADSHWIHAGIVVVLFMLAGIVSTYLVMHDDGLLDEHLSRLTRRQPTTMSTERFEASLERTRAVLASPAVVLYISVQSGVFRAFHLAGFWVVLGGACALAAQSVRVFGKLVLAAASATPVLLLGTVINYLLRTAFRDLSAVASLLPLVGYCGGKSLTCFVVGSVDVFCLWYLVILSLEVGALLRWSAARALFLVGASWAIVVVCSFLTDTGAGWTM